MQGTGVGRMYMTGRLCEIATTPQTLVLQMYLGNNVKEAQYAQIVHATLRLVEEPAKFA